MGFNMHFYIIFGTNLLTKGLVQIAFFCLFQCLEQRDNKRNENLREDLFWKKRNPGDLEWKSRKQRDSHEAGGCARGVGAPPTLVGPS